MNEYELIPHLFRTEYRKIISVLCKRFGFNEIEIAEDIAGDTFAAASEIWKIRGIPPNPVAWLYSVAKNKARNHLRRNSIYGKKVLPNMVDRTPDSEEEIDLSPQNINDSQLQMMFAICHPTIPPAAQVGLSLRILCGFGIEEIANAFLTNKETIQKRLFRAKEKLRAEKVRIELPTESEIEERLDFVLATIYLLFNEGYYSSSAERTVQKELCFEALRLCSILAENEITDKPKVYALLSLMCFHSSRLEARTNRNGEIVLYEDQDPSLWNSDWIRKGSHFLHRASSGTRISKYHLEAGIAYWHTQKSDIPEKWENILQLYNQLLQIEYSPAAALNRTYALSKARGKREALEEAEKLDLKENRYYHILLGELYSGIDSEKAKLNLRKAISLGGTEIEKSNLLKKLERL
ncbi:sigma-70 family RNA polymerase sigma factor [Leptospira fletcheri]|uniref:Sigma-70 family RNA polymerase sigma factor n=1 Tax=Leptospira fletcheri TaxID=2484981 RepID=A0A4V3JDH5_9LEPT|nr:sigma-70 family RNA polymerase sigma factor [Leptospira fletcheri]TGK10039.1 sigma-70 family RNA polymerase sigma factor [Leptospira fletcheri]